MSRLQFAALICVLAVAGALVANAVQAAPNETQPFKAKTVLASTVVNANQAGSTTANCPPSYPKVLGGGFTTNLAASANEGAIPTDSRPVSGSGWSVTVVNFFNSSINLTVYARCH